MGVWVETLGFPAYRRAFLHHSVDGALLLQLNDAHLKEDLGIINLGHRVALLADIACLRSAVAAAPANAADVAMQLAGLTVGQAVPQAVGVHEQQRCDHSFMLRAACFAKQRVSMRMAGPMTRSSCSVCRIARAKREAERAEARAARLQQQAEAAAAVAAAAVAAAAAAVAAAAAQSRTSGGSRVAARPAVAARPFTPHINARSAALARARGATDGAPDLAAFAQRQEAQQKVRACVFSRFACFAFASRLTRSLRVLLWTATAAARRAP